MFRTWFKGKKREFSQSCTTVRQEDGSYSARVDVNGFPDKYSALQAAGAMFDLVTLAREMGGQKIQEQLNAKIIQFPKGR